MEDYKKELAKDLKWVDASNGWAKTSAGTQIKVDVGAQKASVKGAGTEQDKAEQLYKLTKLLHEESGNTRFEYSGDPLVLVEMRKLALDEQSTITFKADDITEQLASDLDSESDRFGM
jgi:hypothetical protein